MLSVRDETLDVSIDMEKENEDLLIMGAPEDKRIRIDVNVGHKLGFPILSIRSP